MFLDNIATMTEHFYKARKENIRKKWNILYLLHRYQLIDRF